jgi:hypothetical protein
MFGLNPVGLSRVEEGRGFKETTETTERASARGSAIMKAKFFL